MVYGGNVKARDVACVDGEKRIEMMDLAACIDAECDYFGRDK